MKAFEIFGLKLQFSDAVENYAEQYRLYKKIVDKVIEEFDGLYDNYGSADTMINKVIEDCGALLRYQSDIYIKSVVDSGCYDINAETFLENYLSKVTSYFYVTEAYEIILDQYYEIGKSKQEIEAYRELRKNSRGKFVGGGFGISGAIKGAVGASALNMVTGLGHSAVNLVGNIGTGIATSRQKRKLYESEKTKEALSASLRKDMFNIFKANLYMLEERFGIVFEVRSSENAKKVSAMVDNIWNLELGVEEKTKVIKDMFDLDPFNFDLYEYIFEEYGDEDFKLEEIADFFGMDLEDLKYDALEQAIDDMPKENYDDYFKLLGVMDECIRKNGIRQDVYQELYDQMQNKYEELKKKACTFDGVVYETPEIAERAKQEKSELEEIYKNIDSLTEVGLKTGKKLLEEYQTNAYSKERYVADVTQKLNQVIEIRETNEIKMLLGDLQKASKEELISRRDTLKNKVFQMASTKASLAELTSLIDNYEVNQRTVEGVTYETQDIADAVKTEKAMCENILAIVDSEDEQSIMKAMDALRDLKLQYVDLSTYIHKIESIHIEYKQEELMCSLQELLKKKEFKAAMDMINNSEFTGKDRELLILAISEIVKNDYADMIKIGKNYNPQQQSLFELLIGCVAIVVIGYILSNWISIAFKISIGLVVLGIVGNFMPDKDEAVKKEAYDLVQTLIACGYIID